MDNNWHIDYHGRLYSIYLWFFFALRQWFSLISLKSFLSFLWHLFLRPFLVYPSHHPCCLIFFSKNLNDLKVIELWAWNILSLTFWKFYTTRICVHTILSVPMSNSCATGKERLLCIAPRSEFRRSIAMSHTSARL